MPCSNRKFTLQFPRCKFCADKIKSFFLTFKYPTLDAPLKWLNNSELRYIPFIAQESNVSSSSTDVLFFVSSNKLPNLRCSQVLYWVITKISHLRCIRVILSYFEPSSMHIPANFPLSTAIYQISFRLSSKVQSPISDHTPHTQPITHPPSATAFL